MRARIVILADGFKSLAAKAIRGLPRYNCTEIVVATQVEVEPAAQALQASDTLAFFFDPQLSPAGYAWCFPKRHGFTLGVGCVLSHAPKGLTIRSLNWMLDGYAPLQQRIGPCQPLGPFRSACIPVRQRTTLCEDGLMLVGDAAGQVSPLWGEGIGYAMRAGQLAGGIAADALANGETSRERLLEYGQTWYEQFGRELQAQRNQLEMRMMVHELPGQRAEGAGRFAEFGPYAEIAAQFSYLVYPIRSREELIAQCGGIGRTFLFRGRVLQLSQGLAQLPDSIYPLESWSDAATKILGWVTARRRS